VALVIANARQSAAGVLLVRQLVVEAPAAQIATPLLTLTASMLAYVALLHGTLYCPGWRSLVYLIGFAGTDGAGSHSFIRMIARRAR